jgi:hypothetical protein
MLKRIRNLSFLVLFATSVYVADMKAAGSCEQATANCQTYWIGMICPWGFSYCAGNEWVQFFSCEYNDGVCGDPGDVYWTGECALGPTC